MPFDYHTIPNVPCPVVKVVWRENEGDADEIVILEVMIHSSVSARLGTDAQVQAAESIALALTDWFEIALESERNHNMEQAQKALYWTIYPPKETPT